MAAAKKNFLSGADKKWRQLSDFDILQSISGDVSCDRKNIELHSRFNEKMRALNALFLRELPFRSKRFLSTKLILANLSEII